MRYLKGLLFVGAAEALGLFCLAGLALCLLQVHDAGPAHWLATAGDTLAAIIAMFITGVMVFIPVHTVRMTRRGGNMSAAGLTAAVTGTSLVVALTFAFDGARPVTGAAQFFGLIVTMALGLVAIVALAECGLHLAHSVPRRSSS